MGGLLSFKIKVKSEDNEINEVSINGSYKIKKLKSIICNLQKKFIEKYLLIYKGDQLLDENNTISSYNIAPLDTLTYKSSKKIYLIFFSEYDKKVGQYVTDDDNIYSTFDSIKSTYFDDRRRGNYELIFHGFPIKDDSTFGSHHMKEFDCIVCNFKRDQRKG